MIKFNQNIYKEIIYNLGLFLVLIAIESFDRHRHHSFYLGNVVLMLNYVFASIFIGYHIFPKYYQKQKLIYFILSILLTLLLAFAIEEFVLEQIFFPKHRGAYLSSFIDTIFDAFPIITIFVGFKIFRDLYSNRVEVQNLKKKMYKSELEFLKSQINPHFLFNSLNNLYSYALDNSPKTPEIILQISSLLRYMLYECKETKVPLNKELEYLSNFIELQELQIEDRGKINYITKGNFNNIQIAPLIFIILVENCFKHSTDSQSDKIEIYIKIELNNNNLIFSCKNTYSEKPLKSIIPGGIGLNNLKARLDLLYPNSYNFEINKDFKYYEVTLTISNII